MKSHIYLDAYLLACPQGEVDVSSFSAYIENIILLQEIKKANWVESFISRNASDALAQANAFPPYQLINDTINSLSIDYIQAKDVNNLVISFLTKTSIIEDELDIDDLLYDIIEIEPIFSLEERVVPFTDHFFLLCVLLSIHQRYDPEITNQVLVTVPDIAHSGFTNLSIRITILQTYSDKIIPANEPHPLTISSEFYLSKCLHTLHTYLNPYNIWANGRCEFAYKKAIELFIYQDQHSQSPYVCPINYDSFSFGCHFFQSCMNLGFLNEELKIRMLLRAMGETIKNTNTRDTHWIRIDSGPDSAQLKRGKEGAWRRDIDHEYHLHYWQTPNGPQFAKVVQHRDFSIPID